MGDSRSIAGHLNEFNTLTSQLESVEINFKNEIKALVSVIQSAGGLGWSRDGAKQFL